MVAIYKGATTGKTYRDIHKWLRDATINRRIVNPVMLRMCEKSIKKAQAKMAGVNNAVGIVLVLSMLLKLSDECDKAINEQVREISGKSKDELIQNTIAEARKTGRIFYLASSHGDCAEDHKPYQGKMYVDAMWWQMTHDERVRAYVKERNLRTVQWVMGKPSWFVTRPNCRHYFVVLNTDEVLGNSVTKLKKEYKTHEPAGREDFKTPAQMTAEKYQEKLRLLRAMYRENPNPRLHQLIQKYEILLKKYLKK